MKNKFAILGLSALILWSAAAPLAAVQQGNQKKIVFIKDDDGDYFSAIASLIKSLLEEAGWNATNSDFLTLSLAGNEVNAPELINQVRLLKPDVIFINTTLIPTIAAKMKTDGIPFVAGGGLEWEDPSGRLLYVDGAGNPTTNITGTYTMPRSHLANSFRLLNQISPSAGKKAVFATYPSAAFTEKKVREALQTLRIELKDFLICPSFEDYQRFVARYNNDPEVGWILTGEIIKNRQNGTPFSMDEFWAWERTNNKKAAISFWEVGVSGGALCALGIDSLNTVRQLVSMADRILKGTPVAKIQPEDPSRTLIILNQARAKALGVSFPVSVLQGAWRVYTDYAGTFQEKP